MKNTVRKWYRRIGFPDVYDAPLEKALETADLTGINPEHGSADLAKRDDPMLNLIYYLYRCEALEKKFAEKGISGEILLDTVRDIPVWAGNCLSESGRMGLTETGWIEASMNMTMFKLGRLQCQMGKAEKDAAEMKKDEPVICLHIRQGEPFNRENCLASLNMAEDFFPRYFGYRFRYFTCHSWLLDDTLRLLTKPGSNIVAFRELFDVVSREEGNSALRYIYGSIVPPSEYKNLPKDTTLRRKMAAHLLSGGKLYAGYGIRRAHMEGI